MVRLPSDPFDRLIVITECAVAVLAWALAVVCWLTGDTPGALLCCLVMVMKAGIGLGAARLFCWLEERRR